MSRADVEAIVRAALPDEDEPSVRHVVENVYDDPDRDYIAHDLWARRAPLARGRPPRRGRSGSTERERVMTAGRWPLIIEGNYMTVPLTAEVQRVIARWIKDNVGTLDEALQPFGLGAGDVALPEWHRLVYEDELPNHADGSRDA